MSDCLTCDTAYYNAHITTGYMRRSSAKHLLSLTLLHWFVLNAQPWQYTHRHQRSNGNVPACRFPQTSVAGFPPLECFDVKSTALLHHGNSVVTGVRSWLNAKRLCAKCSDI